MDTFNDLFNFFFFYFENIGISIKQFQEKFKFVVCFVGYFVRLGFQKIKLRIIFFSFREFNQELFTIFGHVLSSMFYCFYFKRS